MAETRRMAHASLREVSIEVLDQQKTLPVDLKNIKSVAQNTLNVENIVSAELSIVLVDDQSMAKLHGKWLDDPTPTDVITFNLGCEEDTILRGDIVISVETAERVSRELAAANEGWTSHLEIAYYLVHGILHLTGYDDQTVEDRQKMRFREKTVMKSIGLPAPPHLTL